MKTYETVCGAAFEDLTHEEMMVHEGGVFASLGTVIAATTLPCLGGAAVSASAVSVSYLIFG